MATIQHYKDSEWTMGEQYVYLDGAWEPVEAGTPAIPDSAIHRWILDDVGTGTATDSIGGANGTVNSGISSVSGTWQGGSASSGDGSSDAYIEGIDLNGTLPDLPLGTYSVAFTVEAPSGEGGSIFGFGSPGWTFTLGSYDGSNGNPEVFMRDANNNDLTTHANVQVDDGSKHRVVFVKSGDTSSDLAWYVDNSSVSHDVTRSGTLSSTYGSLPDTQIHVTADTNRGPSDTIMDDAIIYDTDLTASEVADDYNAQPWS